MVQSAIEIRIRSAAQLFDPLDPSPNARRPLAGDVASYILAHARERPAQKQLRMLIHGPGSLQRHASDIAQAIPEHFRLAHANCQRRFLRRMRVGATTLAIGLVVLGASIALRALFSGAGAGAFARGLSEGLLILGWVAMWRPVDVLLFEHWESHLDQAALGRLGKIHVGFSIAG
ncbi:MAG: hypothetical protein M3Y55_11910 [Pseudomonadota bacterium]|nr:hypothetical protein [Pseudomonadota bacterium]